MGKGDAKASALTTLRNSAFTTGMAIWAFAGLDGALKEQIGGVAFSMAARVGGLFIIAALVLDLVRRFFEREALEKQFEAVKVRRGELEDAREFSLRFVPEVPDAHQLERIFEASRGCVWFVNRCSLGFGLKRTERVGFFSLIRLTAAAIPLYEGNNLSSFQMDRTHIAGPKLKAKGLYVGGVGALGFRAKGWVVQYLRSRIDQFFEDGGEVVFTRPVTEDGKRLAVSLGFQPVDRNRHSLGNIYKLGSP